MFRPLARLSAWLVRRLGPAWGTERLGAACERQARDFLKRAGLAIVAANYRCPMGEIDLVARDGPTLVFVEVKGRRLDSSASAGRARRGAGRPESAVTVRKQRKIGLAAKYYCRVRHWTGPVRFDVIAIDCPTDGPPIIRHHQSAFRPE